MKNLSNYTISALCEMRHDLERAFLALYKEVNDLREIDRLSSTFLALDETLEEEISLQEQEYEALVGITAEFITSADNKAAITDKADAESE